MFAFPVQEAEAVRESHAAADTEWKAAVSAAALVNWLGLDS